MKAEQLTREQLNAMSIDKANLVEKSAGMKPEIGSKESTKYTVVVDFTSVDVNRLREFAAQKLVISFANSNRKRYPEIESAVNAGQDIIYIDASTIGERGTSTVTIDKAVAKITTPEQAEAAIIKVMEKYKQTLMKESGMSEKQAEAQLAMIQDLKKKVAAREAKK